MVHVQNSRKTNIYPLIRIHTCAYQGVRHIIFSETFAYVLNGRSQVELSENFSHNHFAEMKLAKQK